MVATSTRGIIEALAEEIEYEGDGCDHGTSSRVRAFLADVEDFEYAGEFDEPISEDELREFIGSAESADWDQVPF